jgi:chromosome segregation ATPase
MSRSEFKPDKKSHRKPVRIMRIVLTIEEKLCQKIEQTAAGEDMNRNEWIISSISKLISGDNRKDAELKEMEAALGEKENEIRRLKEEIRLQVDLRDAFARLLDEKNNRIDDLKEEIARIEVISVTATEQINQDKDERINDLTRMIEHLQGQAAAHSLALQSAIKTIEKDEKERDEGNNGNSEQKELIEKPKWMFWK